MREILNESDVSSKRQSIMQKVMYALILPLVVVSGLVFTNSEIGNGTPGKTDPKPLTAAEKNSERKKWEATPEGIRYKKWEASPQGQKVLAAAVKINKQLNASTNIEAVVTSLSLPPGSRLGFGVMARIDGDDYILSFGLEESDKKFLHVNNTFELLRSLKLNDKIIIRSGHVSHAPKYSFPIISGDYVERDHRIIYKRAPRKGGC